MGLTPDWIIQQAVQVFRLPLPTPETPFIKGLLDPCTNSKVAPNIPAGDNRLLGCAWEREGWGQEGGCRGFTHLPSLCAEVLYDRWDDGLSAENSWAGYFIILNPDYRSQVGGDLAD